MFKHILIPTDGSAVATKAVKAGIAFAKQAGAKVTGYHAVEPVPAHLYGGRYVADAKMVAEYERRTRAAAEKHIDALAREALEAGVPFEPMMQTARTPYQGIVEAAKKRNCDLILMSSHGELADKVIQLSNVPVLVYR
jgi:nucleotide-binding universal stress UspA family protein